VKDENKDKLTANKIDVILSGMETIGSAERSCDVDNMLNRFKHISNGMYAKILYEQFGTKRVDGEMNEFFSNVFIERSGGGIKITRLISSILHIFSFKTPILLGKCVCNKIII